MRFFIVYWILMLLSGCSSNKIVIHYDPFSALKYMNKDRAYMNDKQQYTTTIKNTEIIQLLHRLLDTLNNKSADATKVNLDYRLLFKFKDTDKQWRRIYFDRFVYFTTDKDSNLIYRPNKLLLSEISAVFPRADRSEELKQHPSPSCQHRAAFPGR
jgi:hypothetical protein